jgi:hypothetical protein
VPILAVDTPTAVDLTSGDLSDPVVQAHVTVTFHRPKSGLLAKRGSAVAGRVLVAPIGIPQEADRAVALNPFMTHACCPLQTSTPTGLLVRRIRMAAAFNAEAASVNRWTE